MLPARPNGLICVAPQFVEAIWPHAERLIAAALDRSESDFTTAHIKARIDAGQSLLWIVWDSALVGAGTSSIEKLENGRKVCVVGTFAGDGWKDALPQIEQYARQEGCSAVRIYGRHGWVRQLRDRGYTQPWVVMEKKI